jgi:hypothetical protein
MRAWAPARSDTPAAWSLGLIFMTGQLGSKIPGAARDRPLNRACGHWHRLISNCHVLCGLYGYHGSPQVSEDLQGGTWIAGSLERQAAPGEQEYVPAVESGFAPVGVDAAAVVHAAEPAERRCFGGVDEVDVGAADPRSVVVELAFVDDLDVEPKGLGDLIEEPSVSQEPLSSGTLADGAAVVSGVQKAMEGRLGGRCRGAVGAIDPQQDRFFRKRSCSYLAAEPHDDIAVAAANLEQRPA